MTTKRNIVLVKHLAEYSMSDQSWILRIRERGYNQIPDPVARLYTLLLLLLLLLALSDDVILTSKRFADAQVPTPCNWTPGQDLCYVDKFTSHVMHALREKAKQ